MSVHDVPIVVGLGQFVERLDDPTFRGLSPADIAAEAARAAIADAGADSALDDKIGLVGAIRTFEDSTPAPAKFGKPDKYPLAVANRLGLKPHTAILEKAGGNTPLALLVDVCERILAGKSEAALIFGSEAISTVRHFSKAGETRDWAETIEGEMEDHGRGLEGLVFRSNVSYGIQGAPISYALLENARRARLGLSREDYAQEIGQLFAPFSEIAAANPYSCSAQTPLSAHEIATPSERNRMIADPFTLKMVSRDQVNQGAAVLVMSREAALAAGIDESKFIYLHGSALAEERDMILRPDPGVSSAARLTLEAALSEAGKSASDISYFDFYSCFPIAVFAAAIDGLGLSADDPRKLTVTGGLPYFGGAGNNYSMHAIAELGQRLRATPGSFGLVGVNGGMMSKYGGAVFSTDPCDWRGCRREEIQAKIDAEPMPMVAREVNGEGRILTYTVKYRAGEPERAIIFGELESGERFIANEADASVLSEMLAQDPLDRHIFVKSIAEGNRFAFDNRALQSAFPTIRPVLRDEYEHILVKRDGHMLEVTLNRPDQRNSLPKPAHAELEEVWDAFEADPELWVAILTGAGEDAFCAGMDLKTGGSGTMPRSGFAGLTSRRTKKPIIAAINGIAFGGGTETLLACDLVVADPAAKFALTEARIGMVAAAGGAVRLPRQIPRKIAVEMLLTGRHMGVEEAREWGLINRVSEPGKVMEEARKLAKEILESSPTSVRLTMQLIHEGEDTASPDIASQIMVHSSAIDDLIVSEDMMEGFAAFKEKRPPQWKNR